MLRGVILSDLFGLGAEARKTMSNANTLTPATMKRGAPYNWKGQPDQLIYLCKHGDWHQFKKIGDRREVWCEVLDEDLHMLEKTASRYT